MTAIRTPDGTIHELSLTTSSGQDYLCEVIAGTGMEFCAEDDVNFEMTTEDFLWWETWVANEQKINGAIEERGLTYTIPNFYDEYPDWEDAQREYGKYLDIELEEF